MRSLPLHSRQLPMRSSPLLPQLRSQLSVLGQHLDRRQGLRLYLAPFEVALLDKLAQKVAPFVQQ